MSIDEAVSIDGGGVYRGGVYRGGVYRRPGVVYGATGGIMAGSLADMHPIPHAGRDMAASIRAFMVAFIAAECTAVVFTAGEASIGAVSTEAVAE